MSTLGYSEIGTTTSGEWAANTLVFCLPYTASENGDGNFIKAYLISASGTIHAKGVIVKHSDLTIVAVGSEVEVGESWAWVQSNFGSPPSIVNGTDYCFGFICDGAVYTKLTSDAPGNYHYDTSNNYGTPTDPTDAAHAAAFYMSCYLDYTPTGGGGWSNIAEINLVDEADIDEYMSVAKENIAEINGQAV